jgi:protein phosphatase
VKELELKIGKLSDVGRVRTHNEDSLAIYEPMDPRQLSEKGRIYLVADGVGGHIAGKVASAYATKRIIELYYQDPNSDVTRSLIKTIQRVNEEIHQRSPQKERGMGTTIVAAVVRGEKLYVANVGDSRAYLIRGQSIKQLTRDHSLACELFRLGRITEKEVTSHPQRNILTRSLGVKPIVEVDAFEEMIQTGDIIVLCTDGLWCQVSDEEIKDIVTSGEPQGAAAQLVALANERGGNDNITVLVVQVGKPMTIIGTKPNMVKERFRRLTRYRRPTS